MRSDLLAISEEELVRLSNRGSVQRAKREIQEQQLSYAVEEKPNGDVCVRWDASVLTTLVAGKALKDALCTCAATGLCRHIVAGVLAYQRHSTQHQAQQGSVLDAEPAPTGWDPGQVADAALERLLGRALFMKAQALAAEGFSAELRRSPRASARFLSPFKFSVHYPVPNALEHARCECGAASACVHLGLAVIAFRALAAQAEAGVVSVQSTKASETAQVLTTLEEALRALCEHGFASAPKHWPSSLQRLAEDCSKAEYHSFAAALSSLRDLFQRYEQHDARFDPRELTEIVGELLVRADVLRHPAAPVSAQWVKGAFARTATQVESARLWGIGCVGFERAGQAGLVNYLIDSERGNVVMLERLFVEDASQANPQVAQKARRFSSLARAVVAGGKSFAELGAGEVLVQQLKRSADLRLLLGRSKTVVLDQAYAWETLHSEHFFEGVAALQAYLSALPPRVLREREQTENIVVLALGRVHDARFDEIAHEIQAQLIDSSGEMISLRHPYSYRGAQGAEALLALLSAAEFRSQNDPAAADLTQDKLLFVAGRAALSAQGIEIFPFSLVYQKAGKRCMLQPWIAASSATSIGVSVFEPSPVQIGAHLPAYLDSLQVNLGELICKGLRRLTSQDQKLWTSCTEEADLLGLRFIPELTKVLSAETAKKGLSPQWSCESAAQALLTLSAWMPFAQELAAGE